MVVLFMTRGMSLRALSMLSRTGDVIFSIVVYLSLSCSAFDTLADEPTTAAEYTDRHPR